MKRIVLSATVVIAMIAGLTMNCLAESDLTSNVNYETVMNHAEELREKAEAIEISGDFNDKYTWSLSTTYSTGSPQVDAYNEFAELLGEYSGGAITLNVFPDSSLMGEKDSFLAIQASELEFTGCGPSFAQIFDESVGFISTPFLIPNYAAYRKIYDSPVMQDAEKRCAENFNCRDAGTVVYRGYRNMSSNKPVNSIDDMKNLKLRVIDNPVWSEIWSTFGATAVPMALGELYSGLQNGTVDASEGPWEQMAVNNLDEVQKYIIETKHVSEAVGIWMANDLYESLADNYKAAVDKATWNALADMEVWAIEKEDAFKQELIDGGCEYISDPDLSGFYQIAQENFDKYFEEIWTATTLDELYEIMNG